MNKASNNDIVENSDNVGQLKERSKNTLIEHLGIEFLEIGDDYLLATSITSNYAERTLQRLEAKKTAGAGFESIRLHKLHTYGSSIHAAGFRLNNEAFIIL